MALTVDCPSCHKRVRASEEFLGKKMRCAGCMEVFALSEDRDDPHASRFVA